MSQRIVLNGRVATKAESESGTVVFYIPEGRSVPYSFGRTLPIQVKVIKPDEGDGFPPPGTLVRVVQAEQVGDDVILGFINGDDEGICMLDDVVPLI